MLLELAGSYTEDRQAVGGRRKRERWNHASGRHITDLADLGS